MFIIFGIKRLKRRLATVFALCSQCRSPAAQVVVRISTWFSLFFIPLIPLGQKYISTCTLCGQSIKLDKTQALHLVEVAQQAANGSENPEIAAPGNVIHPPEASSSPQES
jgi:hypothetical protein